MASLIIPPGGFLATSMLSAAARLAMSRGTGGMRSSSTAKRRRKTKRKSKRASTKRKSSGRKIKFGSPAWRKKYKLGKRKK